MKKITVGKLIKYTFLVMLAIVTLFPVIYTILGSFRSTAEILVGGINIFPKEWQFDNYLKAWEGADFSKLTMNSIIYSSMMVVITVLTSTAGGFVFEKGNFPGKKTLFAIFTGTMFLALGSASLYPTLKIAGLFHLNNSIWGVIVVHAFSLNITNVLLVRGFVRTLPKEMYEAAVIDGCNFFRLFTKITLPLLKPMVATLSILSFKGAWNEYLLPMLFTLGNPEQAPLAVGLANLKNSGNGATEWGMIFAATCICMIPILVVYLIFNKYFIAGMTAGSVKE